MKTNCPPLVVYLRLMAEMGIPIGKPTYDMALEQHPEYFEEEIKHRNQWNLIPQEVHDAYNKHWKELFDEIFRDAEPSKGLVYWVQHPEEFDSWSARQKPFWDKFHAEEAILHSKHYSPYLDQETEA